VAVVKGQFIRFAFMNNPYRVIKLIAFVTGFCIVSCTTALAQQSLFVYLQAENVQPFYVQIGDKVYSSSAIGHLIISGLADNTCDFEIGFPQHATPPQKFSIPLRNKDHGYQLVKNGSKGWALYDWQNDETIKPLKGTGSSSLLYGERKKDDAFATLMAAVVNDSAVLYTSIVKIESEAVPGVAKTAEPATEKQPAVKPEEKKTIPADTLAVERKVETVSVISQPILDAANKMKKGPVPTDNANLMKNEPVIARDVTGAAKPADTLVTKYDPKEKGLNEKPKVGGVAKVQQQTKDGETKMVFVDSSESPAKVVTVYISEEKKDSGEKQVAQNPVPVQPTVNQPVETTTATNTVKTEPKQEPAKQEVVEAAKKEDNLKKEADKVAPAPSREEIAEQIKKETWGQNSGKKPSSTDTVTIILESRQMKKGVTSAEEPSQLYRPKKETKPAPAPEKTVTPDTTVMQLTAPAKPVVEETPATKRAEEKEPVKQDPKPAIEEKATVKEEPAKPVTDTDTQKATEPLKNNKEEATKLQPRVEPEPKSAAEPPKTEAPKKEANDLMAKDTAAKTKPDNQPVTTTQKPVEAEKPKAVEPEKKPEVPGKLVMINSDCAKLATDNDVDKIRVKMLAESDGQKRLAVANKYFKTMCLYARQIKALSELFSTDEARYKFLEMAYPFAADTANFKQLYELLTDESYVIRFKKLVHLQ
jgi:hypothetical protein